MLYAYLLLLFIKRYVALKYPEHEIKLLEAAVCLVMQTVFEFITADFNVNQNSVTQISSMGSSTAVAQPSIQSVNPPRNRLSLKEENSVFSSFLEHPVLMFTGTVTSSTVNTILSKDIVTDYLSTISGQPLGAKIANLYYFTATIRVEIVIQGQPFAAGMTNFVMSPAPKFNSIGSVMDTLAFVPQRFSLVNSFVMPHITVDPSKTQSYTIDLMCPTATNKYSLKNSTVPLGSYELWLMPIIALISGTATTPTYSYSVYMHLVDPKFEGLTLLSTNEFMEEKKEGGTLSSFVSATSRAADQFVGISSFADPFLKTFSAVSSTVGNFLSFLGFSKPPVVENNALIVGRFNDNYTQYDGKSIAMVLAGSQKTSLGISPEVTGGLSEELTINGITKKLGLVNISQMTIAQTEGTEILNLAVSPNCCMTTNGGTAFDVTPLAGAMAPFQNWAGDILVTLYVICSPFHRGTIFATWDPSITTTTMTIQTAIQTLKGLTISFSGNTAVEILIPWKQPTNFLPNLPYANPSVGGGTTGNNGRFRVWVQNPLTANGSTDSISIMVFYSSNNIRGYNPATGILPAGRWVAEALADDKYEEFPFDPAKVQYLSVEFVDTVLKYEFGPPTDMSKHSLRSFGEDHLTVKSLTSKVTAFMSYSTGYDISSPADFAVGFSLPNIPWAWDNGMAMTTPSAQKYYTNFYIHFATAYLGYRGSTRWTHTALTNNGSSLLQSAYWTGHVATGVSILTAIFQPVVTFATPWVDVALGLGWTNGNRVIAPNVDVVCPMTIPFDYVSARVRWSKYSDNFISAVPYAKYTGMPAASIYSVVYNGSGDDGVFIWFLGFPICHA